MVPSFPEVLCLINFFCLLLVSYPLLLTVSSDVHVLYIQLDDELFEGNYFLGFRISSFPTDLGASSAPSPNIPLPLRGEAVGALQEALGRVLILQHPLPHHRAWALWLLSHYFWFLSAFSAFFFMLKL